MFVVTLSIGEAIYSPRVYDYTMMVFFLGSLTDSIFFSGQETLHLPWWSESPCKWKLFHMFCFHKYSRNSFFPLSCCKGFAYWTRRIIYYAGIRTHVCGKVSRRAVYRGFVTTVLFCRSWTKRIARLLSGIIFYIHPTLGELQSFVLLHFLEYNRIFFLLQMSSIQDPTQPNSCSSCPHPSIMWLIIGCVGMLGPLFMIIFGRCLKPQTAPRQIRQGIKKKSDIIICIAWRLSVLREI